MKEMFEYTNIISFALRYYCLTVYMGAVFDKKFREISKKNIVIVVAFYLITYYIPNMGAYENIAIMFLTNLSFIFLVYRGKYTELFLHTVIWSMMALVCEYFVISLFYILYKKEAFDSKLFNLGMILEWCVFTFIITIVSKFLKMRYNRKIGSQNWLILIFLGLETLIIDYGAFRIYWNLKDKEYGYYALFIAIMMIIMSIIIIKIYEGLGEKAELETRNMVYQTQVEAYRIQISEREEAVKEFRLLKHDMKNHLIYMEELIRQKKDEEVCKYIDELLNSRGLSQRGVVNSGNILVDGLINYKIPYMKSLNIDFQAEVTIPFDLRFPEDNLCIIIGNLLDNAIEGTQKIKESKRQIYLEMMLKKDNLFILIKNPCMEKSLMKKGSYFLTTKNDEDHGMGLLSVKRAVEECQGSLYINVEKGIFQVSVMLPKAENKPDREKK